MNQDKAYEIFDEINDSLNGNLTEDFCIEGPDENGVMEFSGTLEHPMSGYNDSFQEAEIESGTITINEDGTLTIEAKYKEVFGPASTDDYDNLDKNYGWAEYSKLMTTKFTAKNAEEAAEFFEELPQ